MMPSVSHNDCSEASCCPDVCDGAVQLILATGAMATPPQPVSEL